jgi:hypothetical protein
VHLISIGVAEAYLVVVAVVEVVDLPQALAETEILLLL